MYAQVSTEPFALQSQLPGKYARDYRGQRHCGILSGVEAPNQPSFVGLVCAIRNLEPVHEICAWYRTWIVW